MFSGFKKRIARFVLSAVAEEQRVGAKADFNGEANTAAGPTPARAVTGEQRANADANDGSDAVAAPARAANAAKSGHVFISYSSKEKPKADAIKAFIEKNGYTCWMAPDSLHMHGTQDYSQDIHNAIRDSRCLVFALSPNSLNSIWARREVTVAIEKFRKPVIPFFVAPIPQARKDSDAFYIDLEIERQLLNEDFAARSMENWDFPVLLPYLESAFNEGGTSKNMSSARSSTPMAEMTASTVVQWKQWQSMAAFHLDRVKTLAAIDPLNDDPLALSPEAIQTNLVLSVNEAAMNLMRILSAADPVLEADSNFDAKGVRIEASHSLAQLVYEHGDDFNSAVHEFAEPYADAAQPWAAFVAHVRYYSPDGKSELKENNQTKARRYLETAVLDPDNSWARIRLGICWKFGVGCDISASRALYWYEEALKMGNVEACCWLSQLYRFPSFGVRYNPEKAKEFAIEGVNGGNARCHKILGDICLNGVCDKGKTDEQKYAEAEEEYHKAYHGGYHDALGSILDLKYIYGANLKKTEFSDADMVLRCASRANIGGAAEAYVYRFLYGWGEVYQNNDIALDYALAGVRRDNVYCGVNLANLLTSKSAKTENEPVSIDARPVIDFFSKSAELLGQGVKDYLEFLPESIPPWLERDDFATTTLPLSDFWTELFETGAKPSDMVRKSRLSPARFLEFLQFLPAKPDGDWHRVKVLWQTFSFLKLAKCAGEIRENGWEEVFPADSLMLESAEIDKVCALLSDIKNVFPPKAEQIDQKVREIEALLKGHDAPKGILSHEEVVKRSVAIEGILRESATPNNKIVQVACILSDLHWRFFNPYLAAPLRLLRNGYLQKGAPDYATRFGFLFFVFNARYRDYNKNSGALFAAKDALRKAIYLGNLDAVLPFLEVCLSGRSIGLFSIPPDFQEIEQIEPVLWELIDTEKACSFSEGTFTKCVRIAFVMAQIFLDKNLKSGSDKENWGRQSLGSITKGTEWLSMVFELAAKGHALNDEVDEEAAKLFVLACDIIQPLKDKGYYIRKNIMQIVLQVMQKKSEDGNNPQEGDSHVGDSTSPVPGRWLSSKQLAIKKLADSIPPDVDCMAFKHIALEGQMIDLVSSSDDVAILFAVFPEEEDFVAVPRSMEEESEELNENEISACKLDKLVSQKAAVHKLEEDAEIFMAIIASPATLESMRTVWSDELEEKGIDLVEYSEFEDYHRKHYDIRPPESEEDDEEAGDDDDDDEEEDEEEEVGDDDGDDTI